MRKDIYKYIDGKRVIIKKPELLAPAGNLEKLKIAIKYGANAVFIGGQEFGLRANADNFTIEEIKEACEYAHDNNAKVYITANIIAHNEDIEGLDKYLIELENASVDGIIAADPLIMETAKRVAPKLELHLSTQQSTINYQAVRFWESQGIERVVLAREASLSEIKEIMDNSSAEIETFIHGSMCIAYSGRCTLSNHMTARDSNRGGCCQSCRWEFDLAQNNNLLYDSHIKFAMSPKDLMTLEYLPNLIELGVDSLKIEGRMRSIHYIATVVSVYRKVIDEYCNDPDNFILNEKYINEILKCANRDVAPQYLGGMPTINEQMFNNRDEHPTQEFIGVVLNYDDNTKIATIEQRNHFKVGQLIEFFGPKIDTFEMIVNDMEDEEGNKLDVARHPRQIIKMKVSSPVYTDDMMRKVKK